MNNLNWSNDKLIGSLAILKNRLILGSDFISTYIPFVARVLINCNTEGGIIISDVIENFGKEYGFSIDRPAMTTILNKCAKKGMVVKKRNAVYDVNLEKCEIEAIDVCDVNRQYQKYNSVVDKLQVFYNSEYNIQIEKQEVETHLMAFLNDNSAKTIITKLDDMREGKHSSKQHNYIISNFITKCQNVDPNTFQLITDLAVSYLFTSAIAYGEEDEQTKIDAYKELKIYLDTPFILRVLGLNGEEMKAATKALLDQLYKLECRFFVFSHTYDEIIHILQDCYRWIENPKYNAMYANEALRTFVEKKFTKVDVQEFIDTLSIKLKFYKIQIDDNDYYAGKYYKVQIDEDFITDRIIQTYKDGSTSFDETSKKTTVEYDAKSISNILKLWDNKSNRTYKQAKYVLLTTNSTLAFVTRQFNQEINPSAVYGVYPCVTDVFLGTNIWLCSPISRIEDFSEKKLMADCMSIIQPSEALIRKLQESIEMAFNDETITKDQYYLLKSKAFSNDYVMQKTLSDEKYFTDSIMEELLLDIENDIKKPFINEIESLNNTLNDEKKQKEEVMQEIQKFHEAENRRKQEELKKQKDYESKAEKTINDISNFIIGCVLIPIFSTLINISGYIQIPKWLFVIFIVLTLLLPLIGWFMKKNDKIKSVMKKRLVNMYKLKSYKESL